VCFIGEGTIERVGAGVWSADAPTAVGRARACCINRLMWFSHDTPYTSSCVVGYTPPDLQPRKRTRRVRVTTASHA
jgi:hypothetical protein